MTEYRRRLAFKAGRKAALIGRQRTANNRERGTIFYDDWSDGYDDGEREAGKQPA